MSEAAAPLKVFISYSHRDQQWFEKLRRHLKLMQNQQILNLWHDQCLQPGDDWANKIDQKLHDADLVLLLISENFMDSDYAFGKEMEAAMRQQRQGRTRVVPILLRAYDWQTAPFGRCQAIPGSEEPIDRLGSGGGDAALAAVARELRDLATGILDARTHARPSTAPSPSPATASSAAATPGSANTASGLSGEVERPTPILQPLP
jgi:hypothetical protein